MSGARRLLLVANLLVLLVAACGDDDADREAVPGGSTTTVAVDDGDEPEARTTSTTSGGNDAGAPGPAPSSIVVGGRRPSGPPGAYAATLLRPSASREVEVELHLQGSERLRSASLDHLRGSLADVTGKPVRIVTGPTIPGDRDEWSSDEVRRAADAVADAPPPGVAVVHLLVLSGRFAETKDVLGVTVGADVMAVFADEVARAGSPLSPSGPIEAAIVLHELGHVLGLVDLVVDTGREDPEHPGHSRNETSVMYWAVESTFVGDLLGGGPPTEFDRDDLADLARIRNG